jgi:ABC-type multidrug transport system ATPase subunit
MTLEVANLGKRFGNKWALRDINFTLGSGVVGLLGPNGAGKSTLMRLVTTFSKPTEGTVYWHGTDVFDDPSVIRSAVGYLPQRFGVYPNLTAREFLRYLAGIRGVGNTSDRIDDLLALVNLGDVADDRLGGFSGGMRQRVGIAQALLSDPELLVVDEPTVGLDPEERVRFRNVLADLGEDRVVVLSTHIVSDIETTASDVALLHDGQLVAHEHPSALIERASGTVWEWTVPDSDIRTVKQTHTISTTTRQQDGVRVRAIAETPPDVTAEAVEPTLEDAYLYTIGENARQ